MNSPRTLQDLKNMIKNQIQENIHLDYKRSSALSSNREIAKDVSAFANSDGGCIIYGIEEDKHLPTRIDSGVDHDKYTREWLENVVTSNISPRIEGIKISQVQSPDNPNNSIYIVDIPRSSRGPHQDRGNHRYYKRFNFKSQPMEDYEINDVRSRNHTVKPLINIDIEAKHTSRIYLVIENIGEAVAENVKFNFAPEPTWPENTAPILKNGIRFFPPKRRFNIPYHSFSQVLNETNPIVSKFDVTAKYFNPEIKQEIPDLFHIDLRDFLFTSAPEPTMYWQAQKIEKALQELTLQTKRVGDILDRFSTLGGATGLDLSITTLRSIQKILNQQDDLEKISPYDRASRVFEEVLGVDVNLADRISDFFWQQNSEESIMDIEGITEETVEKLKRHFRID